MERRMESVEPAANACLGPYTELKDVNEKR